MKFIHPHQYVFAICSLTGRRASEGGFAVGHPADENLTQTGDPEVVTWALETRQPSHEEIVTHWHLVRDSYVDPFAVLSPREFRALFTQPEQIGIRSASMTDMEVGLIYDEFQAAQFVSPSDPAVAHGLALYVQKGLLTEARAAQILAGEAP